MAMDSGTGRGQMVSQINVTPLVDVMLVLLVIFMVTAPIIQQGVEVTLPAVKAEALPGKEEQFVVSITRDKQIYLNDAKLSADDLTDKLKAIGNERPDREVFIRADDQVPYGEVIRTMAAIKAAGIENVGMVTEMPTDSGGNGVKYAPLVASPDHNGDEQPSRLGYFAAIFVSALGHAAIFVLVFFIAPRFLQPAEAPPPAYTVKIVDNIPAGDLGTHLPRINRHQAEEKAAAHKPQESSLKSEPAKNELALNDPDKNALKINAKPTEAPTLTATPT